MKHEIYKGLVKRLIAQLEIDIDLEKSVWLCNAFHSELLKVEKKIIFEPTIWGQHAVDTLNSIKPVAFVYDEMVLDKYLCKRASLAKEGENLPHGTLLYATPPSIEALQKDNSYLRQELHKVTSTLEIKARDLDWWQNQFQSKSGVETKDIAAYFVEMNEKINTLFDAIKHGDDEHKDWLKTAINKHFDIPQPKCMEE